MIDTFLNIMSYLSNLILSPIDNFIFSYLPDISIVFSYIGNFLNYILSYITWAISWIPFDSVVIDLTFDILILYYAWRAFVIPIAAFVSLWKAIHS